MGLPELPVTQETSDSVDQASESLNDDDQFSDMFKVPAKVLAPQDPPSLPQLDLHVLMAKAKFKSGCRPLPPPPGLRSQDVVDTQNVILRSMQTPKATDTPVEVADPRNKDPLYLDWDANRDKALQMMQERRRRVSHSSSAESRASSGKHHQSGSWSRDETGPKRGQQTPTEDRNSLGPMARIAAPTLDWSQDILEPRKLVYHLEKSSPLPPRCYFATKLTPPGVNFVENFHEMRNQPFCWNNHPLNFVI